MKSWLQRTLFNSKKAAAEPVARAHPQIEELILAGQALEDAGRPEEALSRYQAALQLDPQSAKAHLNAGNAQRLSGDHSAAMASYRRAAELDPGSCAAQLNLGTSLLAAGLPVPAEQAYRAALRLQPERVEAWAGLGCALEELKLFDEAVAAYSRALAIQPDHVGAASNLSNLQVRALDVAGARHTLREFLRHTPEQRELMERLATVELDAGRIEDSLAIQRRLVEQQPDDFAAWSILIFNSCYQPGISAEDSLRENLRFGRLLESRINPRPALLPAAGDAERRLRVGYVSGDFNLHPIANFAYPILRQHDRAGFEIFCYHTQDNADHLTAELRTLADQWRDIAGMDDEHCADAIRQDGIDILVDLSGHSGGNRLPVFARKPAPLQYTWLGYLGTTGLSRMDYRLCDAHTDPPGLAEAWLSETPARLPDSQWCYEQRTAALPPPSPLPRLARGHWTFGSFNNYRKLNPPVFAAWADVLKAIPDARLRLYSFENSESGEAALAALAAHGVERERLSWHLRTSPQEHFHSFADIDVALDAFPYNGATTTCDALLMGVPVLAAAGTRSLSRGGVSLLNTVGLPDWIAESEPLMATVAKRQLADVAGIARLRAELPQRMRASPLMDAARFTRNLEAHYRCAWQRWCGGAGHPAGN